MTASHTPAGRRGFTIAAGARGSQCAPHRAVERVQDGRGGCGTRVQPGASMIGDRAMDEMLRSYNEQARHKVAPEGLA